MSRYRSSPGCPGSRRVPRGALLLEAMLALAVFIMAGLAVYTLVSGSVRGLESVRHAEHAADLARSAMAQIEAGIATPEELTGPVPLWRDDAASRADEGPGEGGGGFADLPPQPSLWELEIETEASQFDGLTLVRVRALRRASTDSDRIAAACTLHQLVRLSDRTVDRAGEDNGLTPPPPARATGGGAP